MTILTYRDIDEAVDDVVADVLRQAPRVETILCISRGGLIPGALLAYALRICDVRVVALSSYKKKVRGAVTLHGEIPKITGATLVVDDLVDSGATFAYLKEHLEYNAHPVTFACLYAKPAGEPFTDIYSKRVSQDTWVTMPWDIRS